MKILLVDGNAVCHVQQHALPSNLSHNEMKTSIIYGFLTQLMYLQKRFECDRIVFAFDSKHSLREEIFPAYKAKRKEKRRKEWELASDVEKEIILQVRKQFTLIQDEVLPGLGFKNIFKQHGYEGDDIIASICNSYKSEKIIIVGGDSDLFQLISANHVVYHIRTREVITEETICQKYQIHPSRFAEMKSLAGCDSDEVPGIPGVGETKAIRYLCGDLKRTSVIYQRILASKDIIDFTAKLVVLPFAGTKEFRIEKDACTINKFKRMIRTYGFSSMREEGYLQDLQRGFCEKTSIQQFDKLIAGTARSSKTENIPF